MSQVNKWKDIYRRTKLVRDSIMLHVEHNREAAIDDKKNITLTGEQLTHFNIVFTEPEKFKITLNKRSHNEKTGKAITLIELGDELMGRLDSILTVYLELSKFPTKDLVPIGRSKATPYYEFLTLFKNELINFIVKNYEGPGGGSGIKDKDLLDAPLDDLIADLDKLKVMEQMNEDLDALKVMEQMNGISAPKHTPLVVPARVAVSRVAVALPPGSKKQKKKVSSSKRKQSKKLKNKNKPVSKQSKKKSNKAKKTKKSNKKGKQIRRV